MANVKNNLGNHSFRMNLLRKKAIFAHKKHEPHEDTMAQ